ncbi:preprotein translocase subunit SecE [uncultured Desulfovibrio sp.]|uniref:Protein translocase subunit SecE n=1 Tax=Candidatus Desulfovibrio intestinavium TaxID=2838534 RepID=A0A9D2HN06_9BACT|nr:preprotein translocase subunit SecE [uncultured Desulfovibrio sp.]HJA78724.1 preprotein translocase subunit SecE [Candidatus Desulfovibrio intestinavium]
MAKKAAQSTESKADNASNPVARFTKYVEDSRAELRKVTWPTAKETRKKTLAVLLVVAVMAVVLGLVDLGLSSLITYFLS